MEDEMSDDDDGGSHHRKEAGHSRKVVSYFIRNLTNGQIYIRCHY